MTLFSKGRPVLRYHGGKWLLAPWILSHFPPHRIYVEPFGGAASVLLQKDRSYSEVYNDLDESVVNLFRILRDPVQAAALRVACELTPYARAEFEASYTPAAGPMEQARRFVLRSFFGFGSNAHAANKGRTGFRANAHRSGTVPAMDWRTWPDHVPAMVDRLRGVLIENRPALEVITANDGPDTLTYCDPPYVHATRGRAASHGRVEYRHEMTDADHAELLATLTALRGMVVVSGYAHPLYDEALAGWLCVHRHALADGGRPRTECLWINPAALEAMPNAQQDLFHEATA